MRRKGSDYVPGRTDMRASVELEPGSSTRAGMRLADVPVLLDLIPFVWPIWSLVIRRSILPRNGRGCVACYPVSQEKNAGHGPIISLAELGKLMPVCVLGSKIGPAWFPGEDGSAASREHPRLRMGFLMCIELTGVGPGISLTDLWRLLPCKEHGKSPHSWVARAG